jgi:8-oxo-dGTP diphosphatase
MPALGRHADGARAPEIKWVKPKELVNYEMPPADKPLIPMLRDLL